MTDNNIFTNYIYTLLAAAFPKPSALATEVPNSLLNQGPSEPGYAIGYS